MAGVGQLSESYCTWNVSWVRAHGTATDKTPSGSDSAGMTIELCISGWKAHRSYHRCDQPGGWSGLDADHEGRYVNGVLKGCTKPVLGDRHYPPRAEEVEVSQLRPLATAQLTCRCFTDTLKVEARCKRPACE